MSTTENQVRTALQERMTEYVNACFTGIYVCTQEPDEALKEIAAIGGENNWGVLTFDMENGLAQYGREGDGNSGADQALQRIRNAESNDRSTVLVMPNLPKLLGDPLLLTVLERTLTMGKETRSFVVVLAPTVDLPKEVEKLFVVIEHDLPSRDVLGQILRGVAVEESDMPIGDELDKVLAAAAGLTRYEAEGAFALSLARHGRIDVSVLWELKSNMLKKAGTLELHRGDERFDDIGGLDSLKSFCLRALTSTSKKARPRGVVLLGVAGGGKSAFAKALGNETGRPTLMLDFGALMAGLVGQTEENTRRALRIIDAMAPCVLFVDEIEKGLAGASGSSGDSGVGQRMFGTLLTWLNDHTSEVFFIATCNDIQALTGVSGGAFTRAERFDGVFFIDLPSTEQRDAIWKMYLAKYELPEADRIMVDDAGWTGAEIKSCCRLASLLDVSLAQASRHVVPVSRTAFEQIVELRSWANERALDANKAGVFTLGPAADDGDDE